MTREKTNNLQVINWRVSGRLEVEFEEQWSEEEIEEKTKWSN
jgi:hypothetical protein